MDDLLVGCDPEIFVKKNKEYICAAGLVKGTKQQPFNVRDGMVQVDGFALEIGIKPAATSGQFIRRINSVMRQLQGMIPRDIKLDISPVAFFSDAVMEAAPRENKELGCTPDFNAWSAAMNPAPEAPANMRSAGGHVHLGWTEGRDEFSPDHFYSCCTLVKNLDYLLGVPSLLMDDDTERRRIYGKAGSFRPKPYGLEYRSLSNFWLKDAKYMRWVFNQTQEAFRLIAKRGKALQDEYKELAQDIIDSNKVDDAKALVKELKIKLP